MLINIKHISLIVIVLSLKPCFKNNYYSQKKRYKLLETTETGNMTKKLSGIEDGDECTVKSS